MFYSNGGEQLGILWYRPAVFNVFLNISIVAAVALVSEYLIRRREGRMPTIETVAGK